MKAVKGEYFTYPSEHGERHGFVTERGKVFVFGLKGDTFPPATYPIPMKVEQTRSGWTARLPEWDIFAAATWAGETVAIALTALYWRTPVRCQHPGCVVQLPREKMTDAGYCPDCAQPAPKPRSPRDIAAEWHGGQETALYAYASTGTIIMPAILTEVVAIMLEKMAEDGDITELQSLRNAILADSDRAVFR